MLIDTAFLKYQDQLCISRQTHVAISQPSIKKGSWNSRDICKCHQLSWYSYCTLLWTWQDKQQKFDEWVKGSMGFFLLSSFNKIDKSKAGKQEFSSKKKKQKKRRKKKQREH